MMVLQSFEVLTTGRLVHRDEPNVKVPHERAVTSLTAPIIVSFTLRGDQSITAKSAYTIVGKLGIMLMLSWFTQLRSSGWYDSRLASEPTGRLQSAHA